MAPQICPHCGAVVPPNAPACPECGSDDKTGWSEQARESDLGLPDDDFDYSDFVKREFEGKAPTARRIHWFWWVVALLLIIGFLVMFLR